MRSVSASLVAIALVLALGAPGHAQESGGSFGGSSWDDEPSGGGGSSSDWGSSGSSGSSDWGSSGSSGGVDLAQQQQQEAQREAERRAAEEAERQRREAEEAAERARRAAEQARILALPPDARIAALTWPTTPAFPAVASARVAGTETPLGLGAVDPSPWAPTDAPTIAVPTVERTGAWNAPMGLICGLPPTLMLFVAAFVLVRLLSPRRAAAPTSAGAATFAPVFRSAAITSSATALRVSIAFDWTARPQLQAELAAMARRFDMRTRPGLTEAARAVVRLLDAHASAARYVTWELATGDARSWFQNRANDLRARFRAELVRNDQASAGGAYVAREHEGQGLVVVSILVAGKTPIPAPNAAFDLASLRAAIASIAPAPGAQTIALEVVWSPASENDRMSSYELEKLYPELQRISEGVGARQCAFCRGPFPTELGRCPNCGAPIG
jgi:uncharacterized membrane protein